MSKMLSPHHPLTLFFCVCLFFSYSSYAHIKFISQETPTCDCENDKKNTNENPTQPGHKPRPVHEKTQETPTETPVDEKIQKTPNKPLNPPPVDEKTQENPNKPVNPPPVDEKTQENPPPVDEKTQENPTKPVNPSPVDEKTQENPTKPGKNPRPVHQKRPKPPTKPVNPAPVNEKKSETPTEGNSPPVNEKSKETPTKPGNPSPIPTKPGNTSPDETSGQEKPTAPGQSSVSQNNSQETSPRHNNFAGCFRKVYAFGDSYTDTGNAQAVGGLESSSEKSNNGLCNGKLMVDFLCDAFDIPHVPPFQSASANFTPGANFAIAGSTILDQANFIHQKLHNLFWKGIPLSFQTQIDWFHKFQQKMGCIGKDSSQCTDQVDNALFWIGSVGVNDYARIQGSPLTAPWLSQQSVGQVSKLLEAILASGAKYVVVQGLPPIGCLPLHISLCPLKAMLDNMGCAAAVNAAAMFHNQILLKKLEHYRALYPNVQIIYADYWNAVLTVMTNLTKYNFAEPFKTCCGAADGPLNFNIQKLCGSPGTVTCNDPSKYISWDGIHLTEAMNQKVTDLFLNQGFCQPSFTSVVKMKSGM